MNILEHPIYKDIYELCLEIEQLPASDQQTKVVTMAGNLERPATKLIASLRAIKFAALNGKDAQKTLAHIVRLCIDAGIPSLGSHPMPQPPEPASPKYRSMRNEAMEET
jgi:hypothetical protein